MNSFSNHLLTISRSLAGRRAPLYGAGIALIAVLSLATVKPAWSGGSNTSSPLPAPTAPTPVTPSQNQTSLVSSATCAQQLSDAINDANAAGLALNAASAAAFAVSGTPPAVIAGAALLAGGTASQIAAQVYTTAQTSVANALHPTVGLPNCDATFAGTVTVTNGGVNVSGNSIFNNNVAIANNASVAGTLSASKITASQGISAFAGAITIGDPNLTTYSSGITLGGGALSGAGTGGADASTGDVTAIAIGNNAQATQVGSVALGENASATGVSAVAVGNAAQAFANNSVAIGTGANVAAPFFNSTAIGTGATASTNNQVVLGTTGQSLTVPGITSALSSARQVGPLGIITTDSAGDLASDGGALYNQVAIIKAGAAVAMALADPTLGGSDRFGVKLNYRTYDGANAIGLSAAGLVYRGLFNMKNDLIASAALGYGTASVQGYSQSAFGGHAGLQLSW